MTIFTLCLGDLLFDKQVDTLRNTMVQRQRLREGAALDFSSISTDPCPKAGRWISGRGTWCYPLSSTLAIRQEIPILFEGNRHRCKKAQIQTAQLLPNDLHLDNLVNLESPRSKCSGYRSMKEVSGITVRLYTNFSSLFPSLTLFSCSWLYLKDCASAQACLPNNSSTLWKQLTLLSGPLSEGRSRGMEKKPQNCFCPSGLAWRADVMAFATTGR